MSSSRRQFEDVPIESDECYGRTTCRECGRSFVEYLVPHERHRATLTCSALCQRAREDRAARWRASQAYAQKILPEDPEWVMGRARG